MKTKILIYGVLGYTGGLFLKHALEKNLPIVLGAREAGLKQVAETLGMEYRVFDIDNPQTIAPNLSDVKAVVNLANIDYGVNKHLIYSCMQAKTHYVDLAAECPDVMEVFKLHDTALANGVMLMPGAGFNLVTTDVAGMIASKLLDDPTELALGFATFGNASRGTIRSVLRMANETGFSRIRGELVASDSASKEHSFRADGKEYRLINNSLMGDVITSFFSTKIRNITAYSYYPWILVQFMKGRMNWLRKFLIQYSHWFFPLGPSSDELRKQHTYSWAQVGNKQNRKLTVLIKGPQAYLFTVKAIGSIVSEMSRNNINPGFTTPSFYGRNWIERIEGVQITVLNE